MTRHRTSEASLPPEAWGLAVLEDGRLAMQGLPLTALADEYGTPLHVLDVDHLRTSAAQMRDALAAAYPGTATLHYALKANNTPGVVDVLRRAGLAAEVMTEFELWLALRSGHAGGDILVNGPCKTESFLSACIDAGVKAIVVDSIAELQRIVVLAETRDVTVPVLLRINPNHVPRHMNAGSATASRTGSAFGLDLLSHEVERALELCRAYPRIHFLGFHMHIGTGLRHADEHTRALRRLRALVHATRSDGHEIRLLDLGGGFGVPTTREFTSLEMLRYQATGRLPVQAARMQAPPVAAFIRAIAEAVQQLFAGDAPPELLLEPGRALVSSAQVLLLRIEYVKQRPGAGTWLITDGGLGTVSMPTWYEYHEVFPCEGPCRTRTERVHIVGPGCFAADVVYRNKPMPPMTAGDVIAVMDSGAYFIALESNFGHPRPAIVGVECGSSRLLRRREQFDDMVSRDCTG